MENLQGIKYMCKLEKILNIHRDYFYLSGKKRIFLTLLILLDFVMLNYAEETLHTSHLKTQSSTVFRISFRLIGVLALYFGPKYGAEFKNIVENLSIAQDIIKTIALPKDSRMSKMRLAFLLIVVFMRPFINAFTFCLSFEHEGIVTFIVRFFVVIILRTYSAVRFMSTLLMCCTVLRTSTSILRDVNALIKDNETNDINTFRTLTHLEQYATVYRRLLEVSKLFKKCFSIQITCTMMVSLTYVIFLMYIIITAFIRNVAGNSFDKHANSIWFMFFYAISFMTLAKAGQDLHNESLILNRCLAKIISQVIKSNASSNTRLKDFQRLVSVKPITILLMPTMPIGMYLLPAFLALAVNYIIVCLQITDDV